MASGDRLEEGEVEEAGGVTAEDEELVAKMGVREGVGSDELKEDAQGECAVTGSHRAPIPHGNTFSPQLFCSVSMTS